LDVWKEQGLAAEEYHLRRAKELYEVVLADKVYAKQNIIGEMQVWFEYADVLKGLGDYHTASQVHITTHTDTHTHTHTQRHTLTHYK